MVFNMASLKESSFMIFLLKKRVPRIRITAKKVRKISLIFMEFPKQLYKKGKTAVEKSASKLNKIKKANR